LVTDKEKLDFSERKEAAVNKHGLVFGARKELMSNKQKLVVQIEEN
jgi:hypothetical protein